jgi:signal transduction histidine kinase
MRRLMDDLLDPRVSSRAKLSLTSGAQPVEALLAEAQRRFEPQAREKRSSFPGPSATTFHPSGDGERLLQVLANLVGNALKFTPRGGRVTLSAHLEEGVVFTVSDTGEGIESADLPRLFDRFYRGRNQAIQGVGLGLSICKGIVDAHGGRIWVESRKGEGARFRFTVPLAATVQRGGGSRAQ